MAHIHGTTDCPHCGNSIGVNIEAEHVFDHIMMCGGCYEAAIDYIFTQFVADGFAMKQSFVRQSLKYLQKHMKQKLKDLECEDA